MAPGTATRTDRRADEDKIRPADPRPPWGRVDRLAIVGAVALMVGLATWGLTRHSLWLDEALSLGATHQLRATLRNTAGTMGLYYVLLDIWTSVAGTSVAALRAPSVMAVAATVVVAGFLARRLLETREAQLAALLVGTSTGLVRYAQEARSYALVALLTAGAWAITTRAVTARQKGDLDGARRWWAALTVISVAGVTAHGMYPLQVAAIALALALLPDRRVHLSALGPTLVATGATVFGLSLLGATEIASWVPELNAGQLGDLALDLLSAAPLAAVVLGALATLGAWTLVRRPADDSLQRWRNLAPVAWAIVPPLVLIVLSIVRPYLVPRYVVASVPGLMFLVAVGAVAAVRRVSEAPDEAALARRRVAALGVGAVLVASLIAGQVALHRRAGDDWGAVAERVAEGSRPGDAIVFPTKPLRVPFEAAWRDVEPVATPTPIGQPRPLGLVRRADEKASPDEVDGALAGTSRLWVLHKTTFGAGDARLEAFLARDAVKDHFVVAERWAVEGDIDVLLLTRP